jgi:hypothetical protein
LATLLVARHKGVAEYLLVAGRLRISRGDHQICSVKLSSGPSGTNGLQSHVLLPTMWKEVTYVCALMSVRH